MSGGTRLFAPVSDVAVRAAALAVHGVAVGAVFARALLGAVDAVAAVGTGVRAGGAGASGRTVAISGSRVTVRVVGA